MAELKDILKKLRAEKNMSQAVLAEELGVGLSTVAMWEVGKRFPTREKYEALADIFNVDIDYLYGRTDVRQQVHFDGDGNMMVYSDFILSPEERQIIIEYRKKDTIDKEMVLRLLNLSQKLQKPNGEE